MDLYYDQLRQRIVCRWGEPTEYMLGKRPIVINKSRTLTAKVSKHGRVSKGDREKHGRDPKFRLIQQFRNELEKSGFFNAQTPAIPCAVCGSLEDSRPHFNLETREIVWLCPAHRPTRQPDTSRDN
ncbi:MAG: hypothetical protein H0S85_10290 [Desulfovibrionaceae bacterium]|jgi:hypothetical protein|nr:hypothetical protein [Desulfovibrionaceae bacterium]